MFSNIPGLKDSPLARQAFTFAFGQAVGAISKARTDQVEEETDENKGSLSKTARGSM